MQKKDQEPGYFTADPALYNLLKQYAKENRQKETLAETILWRFIRGCQLGVNFRRQHIIGDYIADFVCLPQKIIIELDGGYHQLPSQQLSDEERTVWLNNKGFKVLRFSNEEVIGNIEGTLEAIKENINERKQ